jgi:hypothetical protein
LFSDTSVNSEWPVPARARQRSSAALRRVLESWSIPVPQLLDEPTPLRLRQTPRPAEAFGEAVALVKAHLVGRDRVADLNVDERVQDAQHDGMLLRTTHNLAEGAGAAGLAGLLQS